MHRALCITLIVVAAPAMGRAQDRWQIGSAPSVLSGTYGTGTRTDILYTPVTARRLFADGDLTVVFPFTCIRGTGNVTVVGGVPTRRDLDGSDSTAERDGSRDGDGTVRPAAIAETGRVTVCGVGDVIVRGRYYLVDERGMVPTIAMRGHVKVPTASAERGLGTGRPDEGLAIEISRTVGSVILMADAGYTFVGTPAGANFDDTWWYDAGAGKSFAGGALDVSLFFEEYSPIVPGLPNARGLLATVNVRPRGGWRLQLAGQLGLSDTAPDHGLTLGASRRF